MTDRVSAELPQGVTISQEMLQVTYPRPRLKRPSLGRELFNSLFFIAVALIFSELAFPRSSIDGPSMEPTLFAGQNLLISRLNYLFDDIRHDDIAVFDNPRDNKDEMLIKRVIGVPGDTIEFRDQQVYRNGELLEEPYFINRPCQDCVCTAAECENNRITLGPNEYFMMGDNRNRSNDSRRFGPIPRDRIVGKAILRYWPLGQLGGLY